MEARVAEAHAGQELLEKELSTLRSERSADEFARLGIVDELQQAAAEVAELAVDLQEVESVTFSLEEAAAVEKQVADERYEEAEGLSARRESLASERAEHCASLQSRYREALSAPAGLRAELRECECETEVAAAAETEAKETAALLQMELENLHRVVPRRLQEKEDDVARLQECVSRMHYMVAGLEEECAEVQRGLQARDSALEELHRVETARELDVLHGTLARG